jgi:hypothetical protein
VSPCLGDSRRIDIVIVSNRIYHGFVRRSYTSPFRVLLVSSNCLILVITVIRKLGLLQ